MEKAMDTLVSGITKALSSSDECFIQLEEKRIKLDEMMLKWRKIEEKKVMNERNGDVEMRENFS